MKTAERMTTENLDLEKIITVKGVLVLHVRLPEVKIMNVSRTMPEDGRDADGQSKV